MHYYATLEDTLYFWFGANDTSGSGNDGASAVYDVRLAGDAGGAGAVPIMSGNATLLSHGNYPAGAYEVAIAATAVNNFAANATYGVFCTLLVDSQNPTGFVGSFSLKSVPPVTLSSTLDSYVYDINFRRYGSTDYYSVTVYQNTTLLTVPLTVTLTVTSRSGTVLISKTMTDVGDGIFTYDATSTSGPGSTSEITDNGQDYFAKCSATINAATRTTGRWIGRDA